MALSKDVRLRDNHKVTRHLDHAVLECTCGRCGHVWIAKVIRTDTGKVENLFPVACPRCKSLYWNRPRVRASRAKDKTK